MKSIKEIYKIGNGPSSSHTIGPKRAAEYVLDMYQDCDLIEAILYGSLSLTGKGHLTDYIILDTLKEKGKVVFSSKLEGLEHPNTLEFNIYKNNELILYVQVTMDTENGYQRDPNDSANVIQTLRFEKQYEGMETSYEHTFPDGTKQQIDLKLTEGFSLPFEGKGMRKNDGTFGNLTVLINLI